MRSASCKGPQAWLNIVLDAINSIVISKQNAGPFALCEATSPRGYLGLWRRTDSLTAAADAAFVVVVLVLTV